jgi:hypothetical protein
MPTETKSDKHVGQKPIGPKPEFPENRVLKQCEIPAKRP